MLRHCNGEDNTLVKLVASADKKEGVGMMSWHNEYLLGFDLETTGVDTDTALPVSVAMVRTYGGMCAGELHLLCNPEVPIPAEATAIHGITDEMVKANGKPLALIEAAVMGELYNCQQSNIPVVGMNLSYDLSLMNAMCAGMLERVTLPYIIDLYVIDKHVDKYRKGSRKLSALCEHYGVTHGGAHDALEDVRASLACITELVKRYPYIGKMSAGALMDAQRQWYTEQVTSLSAYFVKQGKDPIPPARMTWPLYERKV